MTKKELEIKLAELSPFAMPVKDENIEKKEEYYRTLYEYQDLREKEREALWKRLNAKPLVIIKEIEKLPRLITSTTYEKCLKRTEKEIQSFMSGWK